MNLEEFIKSRIETLDELRALLLFTRNPEAVWDAGGVAGKLYLASGTAAKVLARLAANGLLKGEGEPPRYCYRPESPEVAALVSEIVKLDETRPVTLIKLVSKLADIQAFSDAFKLKKDTEN